MKIKIAPSILSADFGNLNAEIKSVEQYVKREVTDTTGNSFNIEMFPGSGTLYSVALAE